MDKAEAKREADHILDRTMRGVVRELLVARIRLPPAVLAQISGELITGLNDALNLGQRYRGTVEPIASAEVDESEVITRPIRPRRKKLPDGI